LDILIEEYENSLLVAAMEGGRLEGYEVDPAFEEVRWGSVYYARVKTLDPALDAAFLDLDGDTVGIIYNKDLRFVDDKGVVTRGGDVAIGKVLNPGDMIAVQAKTAYLPSAPSDHLSFENKIPQMSMDITMPGRYLIYAPMLDKNRVSQRIKDKGLRKQIRGMMDAIEEPKGFIVRVAAAGTQTDMLVRESRILKEAWEQMSAHFTGDTGQLIMLGPDAIQRTLSDHADKVIDTIEVTIMDHLSAAEEWCTVYAPDLVTKIEPIELPDATDDMALFYERDMIGQIESLFDPYVLLPSGGSVILQNTAALTAVDVNKGGDKRSNLAVNLEAAEEVARQMRLRNIGGIVVVDFLDFKSKADEALVLKVLDKVVNDDPCTVQVHGRTKLGLVEITRKRRTPPLKERFQLPFI